MPQMTPAASNDEIILSKMLRYEYIWAGPRPSNMSGPFASRMWLPAFGTRSLLACQGFTPSPLTPR